MLCFTVAHARAATLNVPGDHATIQACIDAATSGVDECVVAPGTYVESINFNGKAITLRSSGGAAVTTIDGNGAFHVVQCVSGEGPGTILDGFTITGGAATGFTSLNGVGGGMLNDASSPTVTNSTFSGNAAHSGGGMWNRSGNPTVTNCTFSANTADEGGAMENDSSSPTVTNCTFSGNTASIGDGGAMRNNQASSPALTNCTFSGNTAYIAGGAILNNVSNPTITNCTFSGNTATYMFSKGGAILNNGSSLTITNCTFSGNTANNGGGAISNGGGSSPGVTNCILWNDSPDEISNYETGVDSPTVSFSDAQGGVPLGAIDGGGNIDADPLYADADGLDNTPGTLDDNLRLQVASPCIDAGDNTAPGLVGILTALDGNDRFFDVPSAVDTGNGTAPIVDMGAYEGQGVPKSRYITFTPPVGSPNARSIQVMIVSMPLDPARVGEVWWAGPSQSIDNAPNPALTGARVRCESTPSNAEVWPVGDLHLFGGVIVPGAGYFVLMCDAIGLNCSAPFWVATGQWGDIVSPFGGPAQPNFSDINAVVSKFKGRPNAPDTPRTDLVGLGPGWPGVPDQDTDFADINADVRAFKGDPYPFPVPTCP